MIARDASDRLNCQLERFSLRIWTLFRLVEPGSVKYSFLMIYVRCKFQENEAVYKRLNQDEEIKLIACIILSL